MYLSIIILSLLGSIVSGFFGRKIGVRGAQFITTFSVIITTILAVIAFFEVGLTNIPVTIELFRWIDSEFININWGFKFDSLSVSMLLPVLIISSFVHLYSISYMGNDPHNPRFFSYLSLFTFLMIILVTADNFMLLFVGWEGIGVCSYLLISFWFTRIAANTSSISAFLYNKVGDAFLTIGMFAILCCAGNLDYTTVFSLAPYLNSDIITIIGLCLLIGAMAKSAQLGLHVWLPQAMEGPTPVSALIHAATLVTAGIYLLIRSSPLLEYSSTVLLVCLWLGAITTVFSSLVGLFQSDIKRIIAYSTMSQLGLMVISIGLSSYNIALFHLICHAMYKAALFLGAGSVIHAVADNQDLRKMGGLIRYLPVTYSCMLIASLSLAAFPFLTGFYSKDLILESAFGAFTFSGTAVYTISVIGAIFTTLYSVKILYFAFLSPANGPKVNYKNISTSLEGDIFMVFPIVCLALFSIFFGYFTKDLFVGLGTGFFTDNSIFIHPTHEILITTEFAVPHFFKLLPFFCTVFFSILALILFEFFPSLIVKFKLTSLGYYLYGFFNQRGLIEMVYNNFIVRGVLTLGGHTTKILDKGAIELLGPVGLEKTLLRLSKKIHALSAGVVTTYALFILIGFIVYILAFSLYELANVILFIAILIAFIFATTSPSTSFSRNAFVPAKASALNPKPHILLASSVFPISVTNNVLASTKSADKPAVIPIKIYNFYSDKKQILIENNRKSGIYRLRNLVNGKTYIGSGVNLNKRVKHYYSLGFLEIQIRNNKSMIYRSIIKHGHINFAFEILEICTAEKCIEREQYYLDLLQPEYNILKVAGSLQGYKHSDETKAKFKLRSANPEFKAKLLEHLKRLHSSPEHQEHLKNLAKNLKGRPKTDGSGTPSVPIEVLDTLTEKTSVYPSISEAARAIGITLQSISQALKKNGECLVKKKRYKVTKLSTG